MDIKTYLATNKISQQAFARLVGVTPAMVSHWVTGRCLPTPERAAQIERATSCRLTREDLRPDVFSRAPSGPAHAGLPPRPVEV